MRLAVLSDIHSNSVALEACLNRSKELGVEGFLLLGDYISDCPSPTVTMELLYQLKQKFPCWFVRGNREDYQLAHRNGVNDQWCSPSSSSGSLLYTYRNLREKDFRFFESLPVSQEIRLPDSRPFIICHGSPKSTKELLYPKSNRMKKALRECVTELLFCGHTHLQGEDCCGSRRCINPGSVGVPEGSNGKAQFAIYDTLTEMVEFISQEYEVWKILENYEKSGLMKDAGVLGQFMPLQIATGKNYLKKVVILASEEMKRECGIVVPGKIPEKYGCKL